MNYPGVWWHNVPLSITGDGQGGPDPIAQGANLVTVTPGATLTGYNTCFGCGSIAITSITPGPNSLTVAFSTPDFTGLGASGVSSAAAAPAPVAYTVTCTSPSGGASGTASGPGSPLTVTGLTSGARYACWVSADSGGSILATSESSGATLASTDSPTAGGTTPDDPASTGVTSGTLPRTGASSPTTLVRDGVLLLVVGLVLVAFARSRRNRISALRLDQSH